MNLKKCMLLFLALSLCVMLVACSRGGGKEEPVMYYVAFADEADLALAPNVIIEPHEAPYNLGGWKYEDVVGFVFDVEKAGLYTITLEYSKDNSSGGIDNFASLLLTNSSNDFLVEEVKATGPDWTNYTTHTLAQMLYFDEGSNTLWLEAGGSHEGEHLINLRSVAIEFGKEATGPAKKESVSSGSENPFLGMWLLQADQSVAYEFLDDGTLRFYQDGSHVDTGSYVWAGDKGIVSSNGIAVHVSASGGNLVLGGEDGRDYVLIPMSEGSAPGDTGNVSTGFDEDWAGYWYENGDADQKSFYFHYDGSFAYYNEDGGQIAAGMVQADDDGWLYLKPDDQSIDGTSGTILYSGIITFEGGERYYHEDALFGPGGITQRDIELGESDSGMMKVWDYDLGIFVEAPWGMHFAAELLDDAIVVLDDAWGYVVYRNVTDTYLSYPDTDEAFMNMYMEAYLFDDFYSLYGGETPIFEGFKDVTRSSANSELAACEFNIYNAAFDADAHVGIYQSFFRDGQAVFFARTRFAAFGDSDQRTLLAKSVGGGTRH